MLRWWRGGFPCNPFILDSVTGIFFSGLFMIQLFNFLGCLDVVAHSYPDVSFDPFSLR